IGSLRYTIPDEDVTLKAKTVYAGFNFYNITAAPGESFSIEVGWKDWDGNCISGFDGNYKTHFENDDGDPVDWATYDADRGIVTLSAEIPSDVETFKFVVQPADVPKLMRSACKITVYRPEPADDGDDDTPVTPAAPVVTPVKEEINAAEIFSDVSEDDWYYDAVDWAVNEGLMNGVGGNIFDPDGTGTRAMVVTMLWRMAGEPEAEKSGFDDLDTGSWYELAVNWAAGTGVVLGTSKSTFSPNEPVSREQLAVILYRYAQAQGLGFKGLWSFPLDYSDAGDISKYAYEAMCWMTMHGVLNGMGDGTVAPQQEATRAQIAAMFMRFSEEISK
ncbi:MAG: S-layer homology domain-containing protein, partial [Oscillospiraceae bacterium]|nr:S-layer homology domain-containing protein [Oscillospiraceae bacterium]